MPEETNKDDQQNMLDTLRRDDISTVVKNLLATTGEKMYEALIHEQDTSKAIVLFSRLVSELNHELETKCSFSLKGKAQIAMFMAACRNMPEITT